MGSEMCIRDSRYIDPSRMFNKIRVSSRAIHISCSQKFRVNRSADHSVFKYDLFLCSKVSRLPLVQGWVDPIIRNDGGGLPGGGN